MKIKFSNIFCFFLITIIISSSNEKQCVMRTLYNNGTLESKYINENTKEEIITIGSVDKIILFDCLNTDCNNMQKAEALKKKPHDSDFYSCYIYEKYDIGEESFIDSCYLEAEKSEYEKFKNYYKDINDIQYINGSRIGILECFDINCIKTKYIYLSIIFLVFLF